MNIFNRIYSDGELIIGHPSKDIGNKVGKWPFPAEVNTPYSKPKPYLIIGESTKERPANGPLISTEHSPIDPFLGKEFKTQNPHITFVKDDWVYHKPPVMYKKSPYELDCEDFSVASDGTRLPCPKDLAVERRATLRNLEAELGHISKIFASGNIQAGQEQLKEFQHRLVTDTPDLIPADYFDNIINPLKVLKEKVIEAGFREEDIPEKMVKQYRKEIDDELKSLPSISPRQETFESGISNFEKSSKVITGAADGIVEKMKAEIGGKIESSLLVKKEEEKEPVKKEEEKKEEKETLPENWEKLPKTELLKIAKEIGLTRYSKMNKNELIGAIKLRLA